MRPSKIVMNGDIYIYIAVGKRMSEKEVLVMDNPVHLQDRQWRDLIHHLMLLPEKRRRENPRNGEKVIKERKSL